MKPINQKAKKVMDVLTKGIDKIGDHKKIDNTGGAFMPVNVEYVNNCDIGQIFSVTHYYEQNGDLMRDPDMEFIKGNDGKYYPISFWRDAPLKRDEAVEWKDGEITGIRPKLQTALVTFTNMWMRNVAIQQNLL